MYTAFNDVFLSFYEDMVNSLNSYKEDNSFKTEFQKNFFIVSCLHWFNTHLLM